MPALPSPVQEAIEARGAGLGILVLRLGAMGDIVRTLPAVRLVRSGLPEARIAWVAWEPWTDLLEGHPAIEEVVGIPRSRLRALSRRPPAWPELALLVKRLVSRVRALRAGLVLDFHGDLRTGLLGALSGAGVRFGYDGHQQKEGNRLLTTHRVPAGDRRTPRLLRNLELVRALGLRVRPIPDAGIVITAAEAQNASSITSSLAGGAYAVLNPGASQRQAYKKPPAPLFGAAAAALAAHGIASIVVCGPGEESDADSVVAASAGNAERAPATSLKVLAALLTGARVFVGGDSGPLHLACGVGCPVVGLYGPTDPVVNTPWNVPFAALSPPGSAYTGFKSKDRSTQSFDGLTGDAVTEAIREILARPREEAAS